MSGPLLAAGIACSGAPEHAQRYWGMDERRVLHLLDARIGGIRPEVKHALTLPVPGDAPPAACDAHRFIVLLADGN